MDVAQAFRGTTKKHDVPLGHLDFGYITECSDIKHLEKILRVLRSKEEGFYPELETHCEERLKELNPNSRLLRKETPLFSKGDLARQEREELDHDMQSWTSQMKDFESGMGGQLLDDMENDDEELPPIRSGNIILTAEGAKSSKPQTTNPKKKPMPREYRDWDKIDVDKELKKVDEDEAKVKQRTFIASREVTNIPEKIDVKGLSDSEKLMKANREKDKGNEAFRSNDFNEAVTYYTRSLSLQPTAASYNNRALAYLKMKEWQKAITDTNTVLKLEPDNVKALLRRGTSYKGLKQLQKAKVDIEKGLALDPNNKKAKELLEQIEKERQEKKKTGRRMIIEDVEEEQSTESPEESLKGDISSAFEVESKQKGENVENGNSEKSTEKSARRMTIEEVDSESEEETECENKDGAFINGHVSEEVIKGEMKSEAETVWEVLNEDRTKQQPDDISEEKPENTEVKTENISEQKVKENKSDDVLETETVDSRSSPVPAEEEENSGSEGTEEKSESSESEIAEPVEDLKRPVFYMKEMPAKAAAIKEEATKLFKSGQYGEASQKYNKLINLLEHDDSQTVNLSLMYSNRAACHLKTGDLPGTVKDCNASLQLIPHSVKPLLRRAIAYEHLERFRPAYVDYRHVLLIDRWTDQAHQGTKRCQQMLLQKDGPRWRDKVHLTKISSFQIPDIIGLDGKSTTPVVFNNPPAGNQSQPICTSVNQSEPAPASNNQSDSTCTSTSQSEPTCANNSQSKASMTNGKSSPTSEKNAQEDVKPSALTPQEQFEKFKLEGNELVKQGKFKEAIEYYNKCEAVLPGQVAIYTNRALCYIRTNQAKEAGEDCSKALATDKGNVKALFRRAQARKMLKQYREGIEDLKHLLEVDPKNTAAKKEMELMKNYWREELENLKKNLVDLKSRQEDLKSQTSGKAGSQSNVKPGSQTGSQSSTKSGSQSSGQSGKQRKRMVIQEVDSDEENKPKGASKSNAKDTKPKVEVLSSDTSKQKSDTKPVKETKGSSQTGSSKKDSKASQKSKIKETSQGLPSVPKTAPKLDKATPYEFISAWNALKKSETVKPYYDLLKQIKPSDIKTVISNKLDGPMLNVMIRCVAEHYLPNGESDTSYQLLKNLSAVPRFGTVSMFMSSKEKSEVVSVLNKLESRPSKVYTEAELRELRKQYSV